MSDAPHSFDNPAGRELLAAIKKIRRNTSGDPKYHSGRKKKPPQQNLWVDSGSGSRPNT